MFGPGSESLETELLRESEIPWGEIAFPVIHESLKRYFRDRAAGHFPLRAGTIRRLDGPERRYAVDLENGSSFSVDDR
jgi:hypothetical protein